MKFRVEYSRSAERELEQAYLWVLEQSLSCDVAAQWYNGITEAIESLNNHPERCHLAPENEHFTKEIRQLLFGKRHGCYRILFTLQEKIVMILHIRHGARKQLEDEEYSV